MHDNCHAAFIKAVKSTTLHLALVHMVDILKIAYGRSWKLRKISLIRNGGTVRQYYSRIRGWVWMPLIAG